jgi:hypothetical protein
VRSAQAEGDAWKARAGYRSPDRLPSRLGSGTAWQALLARRAWPSCAALAGVQTDPPGMMCRDDEGCSDARHTAARRKRIRNHYRTPTLEVGSVAIWRMTDDQFDP